MVGGSIPERVVLVSVRKQGEQAGHGEQGSAPPPPWLLRQLCLRVPALCELCPLLSDEQ